MSVHPVPPVVPSPEYPASQLQVKLPGVSCRRRALAPRRRRRRRSAARRCPGSRAGDGAVARVATGTAATPAVVTAQRDGYAGRANVGIGLAVRVDDVRSGVGPGVGRRRRCIARDVRRRCRRIARDVRWRRRHVRRRVDAHVHGRRRIVQRSVDPGRCVDTHVDGRRRGIRGSIYPWRWCIDARVRPGPPPRNHRWRLCRRRWLLRLRYLRVPRCRAVPPLPPPSSSSPPHAAAIRPNQSVYSPSLAHGYPFEPAI